MKTKPMTGLSCGTYQSLVEKASKNSTGDDQEMISVHVAAAKLGLKSHNKEFPDYVITTADFDRLTELAGAAEPAE